MKIKTKLKILTFILVGIALLGIFLAALITTQIRESAEKVILSEQIIKSVFELNYLADDYLLHQSERSKVQWERQRVSLGEILTKEPLNSAQSNHLVNDLNKSNTDIKTIFADLTAARSQELKNRLTSQLLIKSQQLVNDASQLAKESFDQWTNLRAEVNILFAVFVFLLAAISLGASLTLYQSILVPLIRLQEGIEKVEAGDLDHKVQIKGNNEFSRFAASFNEMSSKLKETDKMKSDFFWMATHQLRTPLSSLKWNIELLLTNFDKTLNPEVKNRILKIQHNADLMSDQIKEVLAVSRMQVFQRTRKDENVDIEHLVNEIIAELKPIIDKKKVAINIEKEQGTPKKILIERQLLKDILQNIITNAIKYNVSDGKIIMNFQKKDKLFQFSITDSGIGIPQADQEKIFTRFFRATNVTDAAGTGLGLFLVKMYIQEMGGKIWFESKENIGSTFYLEIPYNEEIV